MSTAAEREKARQTRSERELAAQGEGFTPAQPAPAAAPVKPKAKPKEAIGTGRNQAQQNFDRLSADLRKQIDAARKTGDNTLAAKLEARLAELRKMTEESQ